MALAQLPGLLGEKGLLGTALAQSADLTTDTLNGVMAFLMPGNDEYSTQQGVSTNAPGGVASNTTPAFITSLDHFVPAAALGPGATVPVSSGIATLLNNYALQVNPGATGPFLSPFAKLSFAEKAQAFQLFEAAWEQPPDSELAFVAGILPGFAAFVVFSEAGAVAPGTNQLIGRPVGWTLTNFAGPSDGWPEFRGYYQGRRKVHGAGHNATLDPANA